MPFQSGVRTARLAGSARAASGVALCGGAEPPHAAAGEVLGLAVTVRAEQPEVLEPVVAPVAVHVVERHGQRAAAPLVDLALLAAILLEAGPYEAALYVHPIAAASDDEHLVNRRRLRPR